MSDECLPNQFLQPKGLALFFIRTKRPQKIKRQKTTIDKPSYNEAIDDQLSPPQHWHIQHRSTKMKPFLLKLSLMSIFTQATVQTKIETRLGALNRQISFQGKVTDGEICSAL